MGKEAKQAHAWEECKGISQSFGYNWEDTDENVISSKSFINMFVDIVAQGGNLLLIVNLDGQGALPKLQERRLKEIGKWLKVNGEGIYATRPFSHQFDSTVAYTSSKDNQYIYAILKEWPGLELKLNGIQADKGSKLEMLGYDKSLEWKSIDGGVSVKLPDKLQNENNRPCDHAWVLKIKNERYQDN
jgi:alpha-L-fucosidase